MTESNPLETDPNVTNGLKKTKFGTLFQKDTWDLFASLMISLGLAAHKKGFKTYHNAFLGHDALRNLGSFKFIRSPDTRDLSNLVPVSTHTAKLPEDSALALLQNFLDGSLIRDATTKENVLCFKKKSIYTLTPKGLRVVEEFIQQCELESEADHLIAVLSSQPTPRPQLARLERRLTDDEVIITRPIIAKLFRAFAGSFPNYDWKDHTGVLLFPDDQRNKLLKELFKKDARPLEGKVSGIKTTHCIAAPRIIHWLCDNTVISSPPEAAEVAAQFICFGLLVWVSDRADKGDTVATFKATGPPSNSNTSVIGAAEFRYSHRGIYAITDEGNFLAGWLGKKAPSMLFMADLLVAAPNTHQDAEPPKEEPVDPANAERLRNFIKDPSLLTLFRQFLNERRREYDLAFWIDVEDFKLGFEKAAKVKAAPAPPPVAGSSRTPMEPLPTPARPHESLGNTPFLIYNTYLAPSSECRLSFNIGEDLQEELQRSLENCIEYLTNKVSTSEPDDLGLGESATLEMDQLEILVWLYDRIQTRVFATLASQSVPKFLKWPKFTSSGMNNSLKFITEES